MNLLKSIFAGISYGREARGIDALEITLVGILAVFLILLVLSEVIRIMGLVLSKSTQQSQMSTTGMAFSDLDYFKKREQRDLAVVAAVMKEIGCEGTLNIKRLK
ncbi:MAG: OadG family protein [Firmicutes bacterium]|nr:OadG family protein [Bacillota bacterium]